MVRIAENRKKVKKSVSGVAKDIKSMLQDGHIIYKQLTTTKETT